MNTDNEFIIKQAKPLYGVEMVNENTLGYSVNKILEVKTDKNSYILRVSEYTPDRKKYIEFELNWMEYLSNHLDGVVKPIRSARNNLLEVISSSQKDYILCLFEKASGKPVDIHNPSEFNESLFYNLGELMGNIHRLTRIYKDNKRISEFEWDSPVNSWRNQNIILDDKVRLYQKKYYDEICRLPISKDTYGIIHWDVHPDNFFVDEGKIKLFDFNSFQFNWYTADIASAIFFLIQRGAGPLTYKSEKERTDFAEICLISYLSGYLQSNSTDEYWIKNIELFIKYQMADEYLATQNGLLQENPELQKWYQNWHKERIIKGLPYAFIDYEKVIRSLPLVNKI